MGSERSRGASARSARSSRTHGPRRSKSRAATAKHADSSTRARALRLAYNTNGFLAHDLDSALEIISEAGYTGVGLTLDVHHLDPFTATPRQVEALARRLRRLRLAPVIETGGRYVLDRRRKHQPTLLSPPAEAKRRIAFLERAIVIAADLGADVVSFWSGAPAERLSRRTALDRLAPACRRLAERAERRGVVIGFEPEPGMLVEDMRGFAALDRKVDHPAFQLTLDIGHVHLTEVHEGIADVVRAWSDRLVNVHVEDMRRPVHDHLMFGEGEIDVPPVLAALREIDYPGQVMVELSRHSHEAPVAANKAMSFLRLASRSGGGRGGRRPDRTGRPG